MAGLDVNFIRNMAARNNYIGVAGYLKKFQFEDKTVQAQVNQLIGGLNRYGRLMEAVINAGGEQNREKLAFYFKNKTGNYGSENDKSFYDREYLKRINNIGNKGDKIASYIDYTFDSQSKLNAFSDSFGKLSQVDEKNQSSGILTKDGKYIFRVYKNDLSNGDFFSKLNKGLSVIVNKNISALPTGVANFIAREEPAFTSTSYDKDGNVIGKANGLFKDQRYAKDIQDEAEKAYNEVLSGTKNEYIPSQLMVKGYMCKGQAQITNNVMNGMMEKQIGEFGLKRIAEYYARQLMGCSLTQYDVYATDGNPKTHNLNEITSTDEKTSLTEELRAALKEGRCTYSAGSAGGRVGTVITLAPALDKDGKPIGNYKEGRQIFVPGLLEKDAREVMEEDPEASVLIKRGEHMAFGHQYDLNEGGRLVDFQQDGSAYYENGAGRVYRNSEEVANIMLENEMIDATKQELATDRLQKDMSDEEYENLVTEYATRLYNYNNNITSEADLKSLDKEGVKQGISRYINMLLENQ